MNQETAIEMLRSLITVSLLVTTPIILRQNLSLSAQSSLSERLGCFGNSCNLRFFSSIKSRK
jgi:hypothetical protein